MRARRRVVSIPRGATIEAARRIARESGYSRFPVGTESLDAVDGVVCVRDLFEARERGPQGAIEPLVQPALIVPETKTARELLSEMRLAQRHMAFVVDEHGVGGGRGRRPTGRRDL